MNTETTRYCAGNHDWQQGPSSHEDFLRLPEHERLPPDCALELTRRAPGQSMLDGKRAWPTMDKHARVAPTRHCSPGLPDRYLPMNCRESNQP